MANWNDGKSVLLNGTTQYVSLNANEQTLITTTKETILVQPGAKCYYKIPQSNQRFGYVVSNPNYTGTYPDTAECLFYTDVTANLDNAGLNGWNFGAASFSIRNVFSINNVKASTNVSLLWGGLAGASLIQIYIEIDANSNITNIVSQVSDTGGVDLVSTSETSVDISNFLTVDSNKIYDVVTTFVRSGSNVTVYYYVNGVVVGSSAAISASTNAFNLEQGIAGARLGLTGFNPRFDGTIYAVETYTSELSQTQIQSRARAGYHKVITTDAAWPAHRAVFDDYATWAVSDEVDVRTGFSAANPTGTVDDAWTFSGTTSALPGAVTAWTGQDFAGARDSAYLNANNQDMIIKMGGKTKLILMAPAATDALITEY